MSTVILGGGIIGLSTAYYLSLSREANKSDNAPIHIIDSASSLLLSASAYAGGFVALDWFSPESASLGALSFGLHRSLAKKHNGAKRWGYAGSHVYSLSVDDRGISKRGNKNAGEDWLSAGTSRAAVAPPISDAVEANGSGAQRDETMNPDGTPSWISPQANGTLDTIGLPSDCAQIEPRELCEFLLSECESRGVQIHLSSKPTSLTINSSGTISGVTLSSNLTIPCTNLILSAGPWTPSLFSTLFPSSSLRIPISPLAGHSLVFKSPRYKTPFINPSSSSSSSSTDEKQQQLSYAIYCAPTRTFPYAPEAFARLARSGDPEIWIGGLNDSSLPLPETADDVKALQRDTDAVADLRRTTVQLTGLTKHGSDDELNEDDLETLREGLCFRPVSDTGVPIVSPVPEQKLGGGVKGGNVYVASGHGPWGINMSLGTGLVVSEMVDGKRLSADVSGLRLR